jgi:hypothetical protein
MGNSTRPPAYARPCRRGLHTIPAGVMGCRPCNAATKEAREAEYKRTRREAVKLPYKPPPRVARTDGRVPSYFKRGFAPAVVLDGAVCSPATADLFDPKDAAETRAAAADRHAQAKALCRRCPVLEACLADALAQRRVGVWGGQNLYPELYAQLKKNNVA